MNKASVKIKDSLISENKELIDLIMYCGKGLITVRQLVPLCELLKLADKKKCSAVINRLIKYDVLKAYNYHYKIVTAGHRVCQLYNFSKIPLSIAMVKQSYHIVDYILYLLRSKDLYYDISDLRSLTTIALQKDKENSVIKEIALNKTELNILTSQRFYIFRISNFDTCRLNRTILFLNYKETQNAKKAGRRPNYIPPLTDQETRQEIHVICVDVNNSLDAKLIKKKINVIKRILGNKCDHIYLTFLTFNYLLQNYSYKSNEISSVVHISTFPDNNNKIKARSAFLNNL